MQIAMNGVLCTSEAAVISVYDHGFLYGMGLFETFRTYGGQPFLLPEHLHRLSAGCRELSIDYQPDESQIRQLVALLLQANGLPDGYFRLSISAGVEALGLPSKAYRAPTEVLYVKPLTDGSATFSVQSPGIALQLLNTRRNTPEGEVRLKSFHYMNAVLGKRELAGYPWAAGAEGLFLDDCGFVAEGIVSNLFYAHQQRLYTPALETGALPGITRDWVIGNAAAIGIEVDEGFYPWEALLEADELFMTNSIQGLVPVARLFDPEGAMIAVRNNGTAAIFSKLAALYADAVVTKGSEQSE